MHISVVIDYEFNHLVSPIMLLVLSRIRRCSWCVSAANPTTCIGFASGPVADCQRMVKDASRPTLFETEVQFDPTPQLLRAQFSDTPGSEVQALPANVLASINLTSAPEVQQTGIQLVLRRDSMPLPQVAVGPWLICPVGASHVWPASTPLA